MLTDNEAGGKEPKPYGGYVNAYDCCGRTNYTPIPLSGVKDDSMLNFKGFSCIQLLPMQ